MSKNSFESYEKLYLKNYNKKDYLINAEVKWNNEDEIELFHIPNISKKLSINIIKLEDNNEEEFLDEEFDSDSDSIDENADDKNFDSFDIIFEQNLKKEISNEVLNENEDLKVNKEKNVKKENLNNITFYTSNEIDENENINFLNKLNKEKVLLDKKECSICLEKIIIKDKITVLKNCKHIFHYNCLDNWIDIKKWNKNNCPYCKIKLN